MKRIELEQGSKEWLEWRRGKRMASETSSVMGINPYASANQVREHKQGRGKAFVSYAMQHGHDEEPKAREAYEQATGILYQPAVFEDGDYGASVDGITMEGDQLLEIKSPFKGKDSPRWQEVADGGISDYDYAQVQHQMMVTGAADCIFLVWSGEDYVSIVVPRDPEFMEKIKESWDAFWPTIERREDASWLEAAASYRQAKKTADKATAELEQAKAELIELTSGSFSGGAGVNVSKIERKGSIDWKAVQKNELPDVDVEQYRKSASSFYKVEIAE
jgi:putative phage-type endonuclease